MNKIINLHIFVCNLKKNSIGKFFSLKFFYKFFFKKTKIMIKKNIKNFDDKKRFEAALHPSVSHV